MNKYNKSGFTIIEILIVLAIAGLILLMVFLAVPTLQRNSRNNARNDEAARIQLATQECITSRNGQHASCTPAVIEELVGTVSQFDNITTSTTSALYSTSEARVWYGSSCDSSGTNATGGVSLPAFTVTFAIESAGSDIERCIGR